MNNHIIIAGHLGADPEVRFTSSGQKVTTFRLASNSRRGGNTETIWWRITVWGDHLDKLISYLKKGSALIVMGELQKPELFTDREGKTQISLNVVASQISFSPFGRTDRGEGSDTQMATTTSKTSFGQNMQNATGGLDSYGSSDPFSNSSSFDPMARGQGDEISDAFSDDEIPF